MDDWLAANLACPTHHGALSFYDSHLSCASGCRFPVVNGVPVMLLDDVAQTIGLAQASLRLAREAHHPDPFFVESLGISEEEKAGVRRLAAAGDGVVDPVVSFLVGATNGIAYKTLIGALPEYPIPELPLPPGQGEVLLDVGCSWGRWCVAAARLGYQVVGLDPSLGAVMAARRVAESLGVRGTFVVGDARFLPFRPGSIDRVFSYSVLQHLSRSDVALAAAEIDRVLTADGATTVQMPTTFGIRCLYHQARRGFREPAGFDVRYWTLPSLRRLFGSRIGPTTFAVDCFFGIGLQYADRRLLPFPLNAVVSASALLTSLSRRIRFLVWTADSVYVSARKGAR